MPAMASRQDFPNVSVETLLKHKHWATPSEFLFKLAFLPGSQVTPMLQVRGPHFENHCSRMPEASALSLLCPQHSAQHKQVFSYHPMLCSRLAYSVLSWHSASWLGAAGPSFEKHAT